MIKTIFTVLLLSLLAHGGLIFNPNSGITSHNAPPAIVRPAGGIKLLHAPFSFSRTSGARAYWDLPVSCDLSDKSGIILNLRVSQDAPVKTFNIHFRSRHGWYTGRFNARKNGRMHQIIIRKEDTKLEQNPVGWQSIDRIRIAVWKAHSGGGFIQIGPITTTGENARVAVLRSEYRNLSSSAKSNIIRYTKNSIRALERKGLRAVMLEESGLNSLSTERFDVLILPFNPKLSETSINRILAYHRQGGKLLVFFSVPEKLHKGLGLPAGKFMKSSEIASGIAGIKNVSSAPFFPDRVYQKSWNLIASDPGLTNVLAYWFGKGGESTRIPAAVRINNVIWTSHILMDAEEKNSSRFLLAQCLLAAPKLTKIYAESLISKTGKLPIHGSPERSYHELYRRSTKLPAAVPHYNQSVTLFTKAKDFYRRNRMIEAALTAEAAQNFVDHAYLYSFPEHTGELRGVWATREHLYSCGPVSKTIDTLSRTGITDLFVQFGKGFQSTYPSRVLEKQATESMDPPAEVLNACRRSRISLHAWVPVFYIANNISPETVAELRSQKRFVKTPRVTDTKWLCPNNQSNRALIISVIKELVNNYRFDGIHLDYIRYPNDISCVCDICRYAFESKRGRKVRDWPRDLFNHPQVAAEWDAFRRNTIASMLTDIRKATASAPLASHIKLSAAVYPDPLRAAEELGQDWASPSWKQHLFFVCPMNYSEDHGRFLDRLKKGLRQPSHPPIISGIGMSTRKMTATDLAAQIELCRRYKTPGFILFDLKPTWLPLLKTLTPLMRRPLRRMEDEDAEQAHAPN